MKNHIIRRIEEGDRAEFIAMSREFYSSPAVLQDIDAEYHTAAFNELLLRDTYLECYVFLVGIDTAGYALLCKSYSREAGGAAVWIDELYVRPEYRGQGLGSEFFEFLEKNIPAARYRLETEPDNVRARRLYERMGFKPLEYMQMVKDNPEKR